MHLAAQSKDETLLPLVYQAYKRAKFFPRVMEMKNNKDKTPIHIAIRASHFQNTVLLYKECQDLCPDALNADENGIFDYVVLDEGKYHPLRLCTLIPL